MDTQETRTQHKLERMQAQPEMILAQDYLEAIEARLLRESDTSLRGKWEVLKENILNPTPVEYGWLLAFGGKEGLPGIREQLVEMVRLTDELNCSKDVPSRAGHELDRFRESALQNVAHWDLQLLKDYANSTPAATADEVLAAQYLSQPVQWPRAMQPVVADSSAQHQDEASLREYLRDCHNEVVLALLALGDEKAIDSANKIARSAREHRDAFNPASFSIKRHHASVTQRTAEHVYTDALGATSAGRFHDEIQLTPGGYISSPDGESVQHARRMFYYGHGFERDINPLTTRSVHEYARAVQTCLDRGRAFIDMEADTTDLALAVQQGDELIRTHFPEITPSMSEPEVNNEQTLANDRQPGI